MSENSQSQNQNGAPVEKKEYNGSKRPMLLVKNYKTGQAIENAQGRIDKRFSWVKTRVEEIKTEYNNPKTDFLKKQDLHQENNKLAIEIPMLKQSQIELNGKHSELEKIAKDSIKNESLTIIDFS